MQLFNSPQSRLYSPAEIHFDPETAYLVARLHLDDFDLPERPVRYHDTTLHAKDELHITLISRGVSETLSQHIQEDRARQEFERLVEETGWSYRKQDRFYFVREDGAATIIQMVELPGLEDFFSKLSRMLGEDLPRPPTHVTLLMHGTEKGIGIPTQEDFEKLVQGPVDRDQVQHA